MIVRDAEIVPVGEQTPFSADLGINFTKQDKECSDRTWRSDRAISAISVRRAVNRNSTQRVCCVCPGRIVYMPSITPRQLPTDTQARGTPKPGNNHRHWSYQPSRTQRVTALTKLHNVGALADQRRLRCEHRLALNAKTWIADSRCREWHTRICE